MCGVWLTTFYPLLYHNNTRDVVNFLLIITLLHCTFAFHRIENKYYVLALVEQSSATPPLCGEIPARDLAAIISMAHLLASNPCRLTAAYVRFTPSMA